MEELKSERRCIYVTRYDMNKNFAQNLEKERYGLNLTQKEMASELGLSLSSYKRIISFETDKVALFVLYRLYQLTTKSAFELLEIPNPYLRVINKLKGLSDEQLSFVEEIIDFEINRNFG